MQARTAAPGRPAAAPRHAEERSRQRPPRERMPLPPVLTEFDFDDDGIDLPTSEVVEELERSDNRDQEGTSGEGRERGRRRRRRGRGRRRGTEVVIEGTEIRVESVEFAIEGVEEEPLDAPIIDVDGLPLLEEDREGSSGESDEDRPRRRRRRRGGRRRRSPEGEGVEQRPARAESEVEREEDDFDGDDTVAGESHLLEPLDDGSDDEEGDDDTRLRGHRGIPSWDEAIGFIVGVNMEARAKNPVPSRGRGRGGRDRGRSSGS